ncbi:hypothetical protein EHF33_09450 [Deinococcus psychrotolerans]|uniref:FAS1 domain-containing protein n=1 Tax=Deinococcus psychrotolerans TaxID=2489213 RepID=A0A3G8YMY0_9DEIO|nr:hypothetical protein [Deinococcus psychrotolerans]AZI42941.1 hypothetical protein EHF33_09450 [Deinococcus psychrotolerans]
MSSRAVLAVVAGLIVLVPLGLLASSVWNPGLDLRSPSDAREWIRLCAKGREDLYCQTARTVLRDIKGPIVFLIPNQGDRDTTRDILEWMGGKLNQSDLERLVRANLFAGSSLQHGPLKALDGQERNINCRVPNRRDVCEVDGLIVGGKANFASRNSADGAVYLATRRPNTKGYDFLLPLQ